MKIVGVINVLKFTIIVQIVARFILWYYEYNIFFRLFKFDLFSTRFKINFRLLLSTLYTATHLILILWSLIVVGSLYWKNIGFGFVNGVERASIIKIISAFVISQHLLWVCLGYNLHAYIYFDWIFILFFFFYIRCFKLWTLFH